MPQQKMDLYEKVEQSWLFVSTIRAMRKIMNHYFN